MTPTFRAISKRPILQNLKDEGFDPTSFTTTPHQDSTPENPLIGLKRLSDGKFGHYDDANGWEWNRDSAGGGERFFTSGGGTIGLQRENGTVLGFVVL